MPYASCPNKRDSRTETIIKTYQNHYNATEIPDHKQYWAICGPCCHNEGTLDIGCEPHQLVESGLITPSQFHGIEIQEKIHNLNKTVNNGMHWYLGDFYNTMVAYSCDNTFDPAIVNADLLFMPKLASQYASKILLFLATVNKEEMMVVCNFIAEHRYFRSNMDEMMKCLEREPTFQAAFTSAKWSIHPEYYWYDGTTKENHRGRSTRMMTAIFFKEKS